ncbi:MAG: ATP-binding protein [Bacteroidota bacterium]
MFRFILSLILLAGNLSLFAQTRVEELCKQLDSGTLSDSSYVSTSLTLCGTVFQTGQEFMIRLYVPLAIEKATLRKDIVSESELYWYLGTIYWKSGNLSQSAKVFTDLRVEAESQNYTKGILHAQNGLANISYALGDYDKALAQYQDGLKKCDGDSVMLMKFYNNITNIFVIRQQLDSAVTNYKKIAEYDSLHQNWGGLSMVYDNIAMVYGAQNNEKETRRYLDLALDMAEKSGDPYQIALRYQHMGVMIVNRHPDLAIRYLNLSTEYSRKANAFQTINDNLTQVAAMYKQKGEYQKAYEKLGEVISLRDNMDRIKDSTSLTEQEQNYLFRMEQIAADKTLQEQEIQRLKESNRQRMTILFLIVALLALAGLSVLFYQNYRMTARMNETRDTFFSLIAHDLKNPISGMAGLVSVMNEETDGTDQPEQKRRIIALSNSIGKVRELLDNLLDWSRVESDRISFSPKEFNLRHQVTDIVHLYEDLLLSKSQKLENRIPEDILVMADSNMLRSIIRNLVSNAIKFSLVNTTITVTASLTGSEVVVTVTDQGTGMDQEAADKLFVRRDHYSSKGTHNETGTGLGLKICGLFIKYHNGRIWAESKKGEGSSFHFTLPCTQSSVKA